MSINPVNSNYYNYDYKTSIQKTNKTQNANFLLNNSYATDTVSFSSKQNTLQTTNVSELKKDLEKTKSEQGLIGKLWDGFKNLTGIGAGSNKAEKAIADYESGKISEEEMLKKVNGYKEGQKTCVDVVADIASGILAVGAFALAVPTGGASLAVGLGLATAVGAGVKIGLKAGDAAVGGREYTGKELLYDAATGAINGLLAPVTNGLGNTVTKTIGQKFGLKIVKEGAEEVAEHAVKQGVKQGLKSAVLNQSTDVVGGSIAKRAIATGAGMAVDGALGGAGDNMVRAALNGENIIKAGIEGAVGGLIMAPIIGGGFRVAGKAGKALNGKITMSKVLPDGINTKFKQGSVGDCALLSTIDGMMNNPSTAKTLKKSITKSISGDYNVQIGDKIVKVAKSSLTDEMLSDTTGIKIFEQAYKNLYGNLDGGFAEVVAKQFGLNPVHITNEAITDELLDTLAKNQGDSVLSFGALVDTDGAISNVNGQRHYFTIKDIDADSKMVTLTSPTDTSKSIKLSYDEVKNMGISIDGGTTKNIDLPTSARNLDDEMFFAKVLTQKDIDDFVSEFEKFTGKNIKDDMEMIAGIKTNSYCRYTNSSGEIVQYSFKNGCLQETILDKNNQKILTSFFEDGTRKIQTPDGKLTTILLTGEKLVEFSDGSRKVTEYYSPDGKIIKSEKIYNQLRNERIVNYFDDQGNIAFQTFIIDDLSEKSEHVLNGKVISGVDQNLNIYGGHASEIYDNLKLEIGEPNVWKNIEFETPDHVKIYGQAMFEENADVFRLKFTDGQKEYLLEATGHTKSDNLKVYTQQLFIDGDEYGLTGKKTIIPKEACIDALSQLQNGSTRGILTDLPRQGSKAYYFTTEYLGETIYWYAPMGGKTCYPVSYDELIETCNKNSQLQQFFNVGVLDE